MIKLKKIRLRPVHIILLGFLGVMFVGSLLLSLPISHKNDMSYVDALFTAASATCLTGLGVLELNNSFTLFGQIVVLLIIQISGLGLTTMATMIMMILRKKFTLKDRLVMQEALGHDQNKGVVRLTKNVTIFVLVCEGLGALLLMPPFIRAEGARGIYVAIFTSISAFCNAGLTISGPSDSLERYYSNPVVCLTVAALIILGGIGFAIIMDIGAYKFRFKKYHLHTKVTLTMTAFLLIIGSALLLFCEYSNPKTIGDMSFGDKLLNAFFQSSTCRTAGFSTFSQQGLTAPGRLVSMVLMFIGGSPGSAAGGIKTTAVAVIMVMFIAGLRRKTEIVVFKRTIDRRACLKACSQLVAGLIIVFGLSFLLMLTQKGLSSGDILFESVSAFGTVGLSTGVTPLLNAVGKLLLVLTMLIGKMGVITLGAVFFTHHAGEGIRYPEGQIYI